MVTDQLAYAKRKRSWPTLYNPKHRPGQVGYIVDLGLINGKRGRHSLKAKAGASAFAEFQRSKREEWISLFWHEAVAGDRRQLNCLESHAVSLVGVSMPQRDSDH